MNLVYRFNSKMTVEDIVAAIGLGFFVILCLLGLLALIAMILGKYKLFKKAGESGWLAFVPFYSDYVFYTRICGLHWAWFAGWLAVTILSVGNIVVTALKLFVNGIAYYNLAIRCNRDKTASLIFGAILPGIVEMVYGFSSWTYDKTIEVNQSGLFN